MNAILLSGELAIAVNPLVPARDGAKVRLTWPRAKEEGGMLAKHRHSTIDEYSKYFRDGHYTALLRDGALIQVSFDFIDQSLVGSRFCYYPCPLILPATHDAGDWDSFTDVLEGELRSHVEACRNPFTNLDQESPNENLERMLSLRSPIRFDFDRDAGGGEPVSHVHLCGPDTRVPVHSRLSLGQFMHFVIKHFYPSSTSLLQQLVVRHNDRCIAPEHESALHLNWRRPI